MAFSHFNSCGPEYPFQNNDMIPHVLKNLNITLQGNILFDHLGEILTVK